MIAQTALQRFTSLSLLALLFGAAGCASQPQSVAPTSGGSAVGATVGQPTTGAPSAATSGGEGEAESESAGNVDEGKEAFTGTCIACHGPDAKGIPGLGKDLHANAFVAGKTDDEMLAFLKVGRPASDPANTTKVDMPPKGGNPALTDEDLLNIVAFVRSLK